MGLFSLQPAVRRLLPLSEPTDCLKILGSCNEVAALREAHDRAMAQLHASPSPDLGAHLWRLQLDLSKLVRESGPYRSADYDGMSS
jgi:hypothetical protein